MPQFCSTDTVIPEYRRVFQAREIALRLLAGRVPGATICPSEVARAIASAGSASSTIAWRDMMPIVHQAIDRLLEDGLIRLSWKGEHLAARAGPYRIGRASDRAPDSAR